jgi:membrane-associated phospholipid phosphatase
MGRAQPGLQWQSGQQQSSGLRQSALQQWDNGILEYLAGTRTPGQTGVFRLISNANNYVNVAVPAGLLVAGWIRNDGPMRQNALYIASSSALAAFTNYLIKQWVRRPRPFLINIRLTPVYRPGGYSFPSGHSSFSFSTATALSRAYPKWYVIAPAFLWASSVGYSRMYLGVHNPSDVAAGALLGAGSAFAMGFVRPQR